MSESPIYLDCNATTPLEPEVRAKMLEYFDVEYGNAGSRTHEFGARARQATEKARRSVAAIVGAQSEDVIFTSGATESNNLAISGLAAHGIETGCKHVIATQIEHKAVLEPIKSLENRGFDVTLLPPTSGGWVEVEYLADVLRDDTLLVSIMHVNNETGVEQPLEDYADVLDEHPAFFHVDAAQGFGKRLAPLQNSRIDLISISAHKVYGPKGVGALVARRRRFKRPPLEPLFRGGGQERGLRSGTLPVPLVVGLGEAARLALRDHEEREAACRSFRERALKELGVLPVQLHGDGSRTLPHTVNLSIEGVDAEAAMVALKGLAAISNGSSCTSASYEPSHVLQAMGLSPEEVNGALRFSWCHLTPEPEWSSITQRLRQLS